MEYTSVSIDDHNIMWIDGGLYQVPEGLLDSAVTLLDRLGTYWGRRSGTVLISAKIGAHFGFPRDVPARDAQQRNHGALQGIRDAGWSVKRLSPWMNIYRPDTGTIHLGIMPWLETSAQRWPLLDPYDGADMTYRMARLQQWMGIAPHTQMGVYGLDCLRRGARGTIPRWRPEWSEECLPATQEWEVRDLWATDGTPSRRWYHGYDITKQYLNSMGMSLLGIQELTHTGLQPYAKGQAGWWLITAPPWRFEELCPAPYGSHYRAGEQIWVTAPTMDLLSELATSDAAPIIMPPVLDSWTSIDDAGTPSATRIMRGWADRIKAGFRAAENEDREIDQTILTAALKGTYTQSWGMLMRSTSMVHRPDWHHTISALARVLLWRKIWTEGCLHRHWPQRISHDCVYYPSRSDNWITDPPQSFDLLDEQNTPRPPRLGKLRWTETEDTKP